MELDLVVGPQHCAFQCAVSQVVREEQLIENHMVLAHIRVLNREPDRRSGFKDIYGLLIIAGHISELFRFSSVPQLENKRTNQRF